jgi:DNA/RNA-binding domain of Phe-tRNA-synthetase-like protein
MISSCSYASRVRREARARRTMKRNQVPEATDAWRRAFPGAVVGALVMTSVRNPERSAALENAKRRLEHVLRPYVDYYRARGTRYQVKAQRDSVTLKGKRIPSRAALVEAMFMAELKNLILTAGHDLDAMTPPLLVDVTADGDRYILLNGNDAVLTQGDMMMTDGAGIVASVLRGPDRRTRITPETHSVLFVAYAPAGVGETAVEDHLSDIRANVRLVAPEAPDDLLTILAA